ncbi:MAG: IS110 family transposase [Acidimicrobiia bacterium]|nr:IS110 family transposase [Acidimicrobiia bacterium]
MNQPAPDCELKTLDGEKVNLSELRSLARKVELLQTIRGIRETASAAILAESGPDMEPFATPAKFSSWPG